ncbi:tripartite motif-containing protein 66-like [Syngnathoides biaculeatus]|uniref:tripartite motif-containing protein 66-like n=1 Tax=Syngnathoides biaculeatus TaxID=300417 RepID=UPI002ADE789E|nr:tripartite motif-containing protein 66-like [Syngnathoides biaculeatus]XP_061679299.1 tripartite motif-containing protein 66-like [Syngnathoides biaculeatus]XP_061679300.1 tripartite motif-containing protein 66-like [Syngnathoides biaculeatus]
MEKERPTDKTPPFIEKHFKESLLNKIRIRPEVQRVLNNSGKAVVRLERLNLQPLASVVQVPCQKRAELYEENFNCPWENEVSPVASDIVEIQETEEDSTTTIRMGELHPDGSPNPDPPYILVHSGKAEPDTFYVDPDREMIMVLELEPDQTQESKCGEPSPPREAAQNSGGEKKDSEDFCAVCLNGGDLLCCDLCPKVYHLACHLPSLITFPTGDWACTLCRTERHPAENIHREGVEPPYALSRHDQRRCEKLTLLLYVHPLSAPFHEPVSRLARNYYQVIKKPMDLSLIRKKLDKSNTLHYFMPEHFVHDVLLMLKNCATFNYVG